MKLDFIGIGGQPGLSCIIQPVAGPVVDDQEDFLRRMDSHQLFEELVEGVAVEDVRELVRERGSFEADGPEDVGRLSEPEGIYPRLDPDLGPGLVERSVEPEAGLVLEDDRPSASSRFFFISGRRSLIHFACCS